MGGGTLVGLISFRVGTNGGLNKYGNEPFSFMRCGEFPEYVSGASTE